jgi:hypothetical protein
MYLDNQKKFTLVLNRRIAVGPLINAASHLCIGLAGEMEGMDILDYRAADRPGFARISCHPVIVLSADNSDQLRALYERAQAKSIRVNVFTASMIGRSADEQLAATAALLTGDMEFLAIGLFGPGDRLKELTRRHSLWR